MRTMRAWLLRLGAALVGRGRDGSVADELNSHLQMHIDDNVRAGMTLTDARRAALMKLGGLAQTAESIRELLAAVELNRYFPMLMTAAGMVKPAKVFVIGTSSVTASFGRMYQFNCASAR